ncbi:hypothetical protein PS862_00016 [Pseudomonas fluorescens]|uniref:Uncharacterized protein n=1 Tax=Pseudomonas fluorescens TaxID=294 RepID=A0A5E7G1M2_PSEFL|nr:hypothetical protein PS862_00016 [Pseudomonas fluorescens]
MQSVALTVRWLSQQASMLQEDEPHERFYTLWADYCLSQKGCSRPIVAYHDLSKLTPYKISSLRSSTVTNLSDLQVSFLQ